MSAPEERNEDDTSVRVALRIRPQLARERIDMCQVCTAVMPSEKQVLLGKDKAFTFDYVYDLPTMQEFIYKDCVEKLIEGCFEGYNATVFAYGQTGSGKTYTMGTGFDVNIPEAEIGIVPRAVDHLFRGIEERKRQAMEKNEPPPDFKVNAQFMELYNEEILDLLDTTRDPESRGRKSNAKIHEDASGGIYVVGTTTRLVYSLQETMQCLQVGALSRATASTNMNATSSRSHAIFTLHIKQHRVVREEQVLEDEGGEDVKMEESNDSLNEFETLTAKFHFVDLAGSERLKRTGATGDRAKEGISINCGLLALGNVISALGDKLKKGSHVPYRDSKLTRLLQDSLGGNSRTLMIACVSPSDRDFMETLNTLKYANRARNIKNKVIANQDKASKQLAILRQEIVLLQQELMEYKTGKRIVDSEGVETTSDVFHENTMLQTENDKLRTRIKSLNETVDQLTVRNTELLASQAMAALGNAAGDVGSEEVVNLIKGYVKELEELRAKLAESELMVERVKRSRPASISRVAMSPMLSPVHSSIGMSQSFESPLSPDNHITTIIEEAKRDVKRLKKKKKVSERHDSDKENEQSDEEKATTETTETVEGEVMEKDRSEKSEKDEAEENVDVNGNLDLDKADSAEDSDDDEEELEVLSSSSSSETDSDGKDSDNIHEDLAELTCEISIKQRLIEELEQSQKRLYAMKVQYEEKVELLVTKIRETESERDKVLSGIGKIETNKSEQTKKVKEQYERKLNDMQNELKKLHAAKKEHARLVKNQSHYEKQLKTLQHELGEMKKTKVRLMKQMKEDAEKTKQFELRKNKEMAQLRKEQIKKEGLIRTLENQKRQKDMVLKRKQEELASKVEVLRKKNRPMSSRTAGRVANYSKPTIVSAGPLSTSSPMRRRRRGEFSAKVANKKWMALEKNVNAVINKKQTISNIEKDMDVWLKHREKLGKKMEKCQKKKETMVALGNPDSEIKEVTDVIDSLKNQVEFAQDNINECQTNIVQVEEAKEEAEKFDPMSLVNTISLEEAKYLLEHFINMSISKGLALSAKDSEVRELMAKLHQTELNNTLQQDLLKHMMADRVDIEVDNLMTNQVDDMDSSTSSSSSSPVDSMFESRVESSAPTQKPSLMSSSSWEAAVKKDKELQRLMPTFRRTSKFVSCSMRWYRQARRRTPSRPDELLYAGNEEQAPMLNRVLETPDESSAAVTKIPPVMSMSAPPTTTVTSSDGTLMPPPKSLPPRQTSSSRLSTISPSMRRKDYSKPSPSPSPVLRRKNSFTILSRSSSMDNATSSDATPPSSPQPTRRSERPSEANVFSRLTSSTVGISDNKSKRGYVVPANRTGRCWDLTEGREIVTFDQHLNNVNVIKYSPEQRLVFTVSQSYICVWDLRRYDRNCIKTLSSSGLTQDDQITSETRQIDLPSGEHHINDIALNNSGILLYSATGNVVRVWDLRRFAAVGKLSGGHQAAIMTMGVDKQDQNDIVVTGSKDHYIKVFEVMSEGAGVLTPKYNLEPPHYDGIQSLAIQGNTLFSGSRDTCIKKWDLQSHSLVQSLNAAHRDWICAMDFMKGTNTLLSGCRAGYLKLWNVDTCAQIAEIKAHTSPINAIANNSSAIFTASNDHTVRIWRQKTGSQELATDGNDWAS
ncbi:kinesin-like protein KIF21A [Mercenaria mercenaria]|uniref:kinesin-like protein KIF21A n=1 Tax=Mercenaria mercenaria TaxID=6596 RepID=UPI00234F739B|nr:kinesin-like protein KIF21A [Mercenaria mercenaria]